jgi:hypothetical protein
LLILPWIRELCDTVPCSGCSCLLLRTSKAETTFDRVYNIEKKRLDTGIKISDSIPSRRFCDT